MASTGNNTPVNRRSDEAVLRHYLVTASLDDVIAQACALRDQGFPRLQTYSPKVFIPLTQLCRDYCHYCTFSRPAHKGQKAFLTPDEVLKIARAGQLAGCTEALFTLGDKPELRHAIAREELATLGHDSTLSYLQEMCERVLSETGLLPHINAGVMSRNELAQLRSVSASQGLMLETASSRLCQKGQAHYQSPDKDPAVRLQMIRDAGELAIPFTTGLLIGIGETREERLDAMFLLRDLHQEYGHIQEVIIQNFRAKPGTPMQDAPEPTRNDYNWTIAAARLIFGPDMSLQAPPNLSSENFAELIDAGINDWGGISPITPDFVNPEAPWPMLDTLKYKTAKKGRILAKRLTIYPEYCRDLHTWAAPEIATHILRASDSSGLSRNDSWAPGGREPPYIAPVTPNLSPSPHLRMITQKAQQSHRLSIKEMVDLFESRDGDVEYVCQAADELRQALVGVTVTYAVNRNINYTNICGYRCSFCAFSKGRGKNSLRGDPYNLQMEEIVRRAQEAVDRGASEVCLQGGIHPDYDGNTYLGICRAIKAVLPDLHIHAFSPLEVMHGSQTLGLPVEVFLAQLKDAGLSTLPGTAAEILDDDIRSIICPDKLNSSEWLHVLEAAHSIGLKTTSTIMFGHVEQPVHWARHIQKIRDLQERTGGITEFVPLPFVHSEAPMSRLGQSRLGPTFREVRLMHAVARLAFNPVIVNIQTSWVKLGEAGIRACLTGGANDLGGTLMNESISRAAGASHGQEMPPEDMEHLISSLGRVPLQRTTLYGTAPANLRDRSFDTSTLGPVINSRPRKNKQTLQSH